MSNRYGKVVFLVLVTASIIALLGARRPRGRRGYHAPPPVAAATPDAGPPLTEAIAFGIGQSNAWYQAQDTTAQYTTTVDAGVWRGGVDASSPMPEVVQGIGSGGTGNDYASSDVVIGRELYRLRGMEQYLIKGPVQGGATLATLLASSVYTDTFDDFKALDMTCSVAGNTGCHVPYVVIDHGESDELGPTLTYGADLITAKNDIMTELSSSRGVGGDWLARWRPKFYQSINSQWPKMVTTIWQSAITPQQESIAVSDADIIVCGSSYHYGDTATSVWNEPPNHVHMEEIGQTLKGEHRARCIHAYLENNITVPIVMYPQSASCSGSNIVLEYDGSIMCDQMGDCNGATQLVLDTTNVLCPSTGLQGGICRYGFEIDDPNPNPRWINAAPTIINTTQINIPLSGACRAGTTVSYARTAIPNSSGGNGLMATSDDDIGGPRGNLRDNTTTVGGITGQAVYSWATPFTELSVTGGAAGDSSIATLVDDINWDYVIDGADCPTGTNAWTNSGAVGGTFAHIAGTVTCAQDTGATPSAQIGAGNVDQAVAPASSLYRLTAQNLDADDDLLFMWGGCAHDNDLTQDLVHWWGATQEYFRIFIGSTGTMTAQFDTRTNGGSALMSQNLIAAFPNVATDRRELIAVMISRDGHSGNHYITMCSLGNGCVSTSKAGTFLGMSSADINLLANRLSSNFTEGDTYFTALTSGEKIREKWENYVAFEDWYEVTAGPTFCATPPCACDDGFAAYTTPGGFQLAMIPTPQPAFVQADLALPAPPDGGVVTPADGGGNWAITTDDYILDCAGRTMGDISIACNVNRVRVTGCNASSIWNTYCSAGTEATDIEIDHNHITNTTGGQEAVRLSGDRILVHSNHVDDDNEYCFYAENGGDTSNMEEDWVIFGNYCSWGTAQAGSRLYRQQDHVMAMNHFESKGDTAPAAIRYNGGQFPDAGAGGDAGVGSHNVFVGQNIIAGGNSIHFHNVTPDIYEIYGSVYVYGNQTWMDDNDPLSIDNTNVDLFDFNGNTLTWAGGSWPYEQNSAQTTFDANVVLGDVGTGDAGGHRASAPVSSLLDAGVN